MAEAKKVRGVQLIRADRSVPGAVTFYDTRVAEAAAARIGTITVPELAVGDGPVSAMALSRAAVHGYTQAVLDCSNKLDGDARVAWVRKMVDVCNAGGWPTAPVDEGAATQRAIDALMRLPASPERDAMVARLRADAASAE